MVAAVYAIPQPRVAAIRRAENPTPACLPQDDPDPKARAAGVQTRNEGFIYGPSLIGEAAPFPNGTLGNARHEADMDIWRVDREEIDARVAKDVQAVQAAILAVSPDNGPPTSIRVTTNIAANLCRAVDSTAWRHMPRFYTRTNGRCRTLAAPRPAS